MHEDSTLELLSPELQLQILLQSSNLDTLYALIRASPRFYQVFQLNKETTLSAVALCQFHPAVQPEAVAIAQLEQLEHQSRKHTLSQRDLAIGFCNAFPNQIKQWCESNASEEVSTDLCKLDKTIKVFIDDYARSTLPVLDQLGLSQDVEILPEYPTDSHASHPQPSPTEIGRLQRAFCRFELYRRLFSQCSQELHHGIHRCFRFPALTTTEQAKMFLQHLPAFQIAEIACIRDYLFRRLRGIYDDLQNEAVRILPVEAMTFKEHDESAMCQSPFYMFTTHAKHYQKDHLEHLISLGLPYIRRIVETTGDEQRDLFLHHVHSYVVSHLTNDFLSEALECLGPNPDAKHDHRRFLDAEKVFTPACDEDGWSEHPQGWLWGHYHLPPRKLNDNAYKGLRDWGYVFWDYDRLQKSGILREDPEEVRKISFRDYRSASNPSVEQRLHAIYPPISSPKKESDSQKQPPRYYEEFSVASVDEILGWDRDQVTPGSCQD